MYVFDTETCGLHGPIVLLQWAKNDGPIHLHEVWNSSISSTLELIEDMVNDPEGVVGFNLGFDWFHICQLYTTLKLFPDPSSYPVDCIEQYAYYEPEARDGPCLKPRSAFDVMLHARKGPYQSTMARGDIRIRRVPTALAWELASELETRIPLKQIYFANKKDKFAKRWQVYDIKDSDGDIDPAFKDIVLKFNPSSALKALASDAFNLEEDAVLLFTDIEISKKLYPKEYGYAPFALAVGNRQEWNHAWPAVIQYHIDHWAHHDLARRYAVDDVTYTRDLYHHFGDPPLGDDDSVLACMVGAVRWRGFTINHEKIKALRERGLQANTKIINGKPFKIPTVAKQSRIYITEQLDDTELVVQKIKDSTKKVLLEEIALFTTDCPTCKGTGECQDCGKEPEWRQKLPAYEGPIEKGGIPHPAAERAWDVLHARQSNYAVGIFDKLLRAGRFHASFEVIGALSDRMSGKDDLNAQGIQAAAEVRECFTLFRDETQLDGGDFDGFEVTLADAAYGDLRLRADLMSGKKIHALFGVNVYPWLTYEDLLKKENKELYKRAKSAVFALFYGGEGFTLKTRLGVDLETAEKARELFCKQYPGVGRAQKRIEEMFISMRQPGGIGSRVVWHEPHDYIESLIGFRRYFTLENAICKALYQLAEAPPKHWRNIEVKVQRSLRDTKRIQSASGAVQSALFGAAFALQSANKRAAINHEIQSSGAQITKAVQRKIWDVQPTGITKWLVQPMNIHDEILSVTDPSVSEQIKEVVDLSVESFRPKVPLLKMIWKQKLSSWGEKE